MADIIDFKFTETDYSFLRMAALLAERNVDEGGGPFGAVIVCNGEVIATGVNRVTINNDPTAHAEVSAIRDACARLSTHKLTNCVIYASCEPCPMCLSAIYWAGISRVYYGNTQEDADAIDFSDRFIYDEFQKPKRQRLIPCLQIPNDFTEKAFEKWTNKEDKVKY